MVSCSWENVRMIRAAAKKKEKKNFLCTPSSSSSSILSLGAWSVVVIIVSLMRRQRWVDDLQNKPYLSPSLSLPRIIEENLSFLVADVSVYFRFLSSSPTNKLLKMFNAFVEVCSSCKRVCVCDCLYAPTLRNSNSRTRVWHELISSIVTALLCSNIIIYLWSFVRPSQSSFPKYRSLGFIIIVAMVVIILCVDSEWMCAYIREQEITWIYMHVCRGMRKTSLARHRCPWSKPIDFNALLRCQFLMNCCEVFSQLLYVYVCISLELQVYYRGWQQ